MQDDILVLAHVGDLHLTDSRVENARDYRAILAQIGEIEGLDFVYLPGDNADNGRPEQYTLVRAGLDGLRLPIHVITGDHDMEGGSLDAFYAGLGVPRLPYAVTVSGTRCLFLDMCGPGSGGPDFRLGANQIAWLEAELRAAETRGQICALFMHSYPADLRGEGEAERVARAAWPEGGRRLAVRARDAEGGIDEDAVEPADAGALLATSKGIGSDADAVGAWPERGLLGTQLGPNRNGRQW